MKKLIGIILPAPLIGGRTKMKKFLDIITGLFSAIVLSAFIITGLFSVIVL